MTQARRRAGGVGLALAAPAAILLIGLLIGPSLLVLGFSLTDYQLGAPERAWVGSANYAALADAPDIGQSVVNTLVFVAVVAPTSIFGALWIAVALAPLGRLGRWAQTVFFLPITATLVAMATAWEVVLHPTFGMANALLGALGLEGRRFLSDPDLALWTLSAIAVWKMLGYNVVLFLAGLAAIPRQLYEAAAVDGAGRGLGRFFLVTWPGLVPVTLFVSVLTVIRALSEFELVAVLTQGGPNGATSMILWTLHTTAFRFFDIGLASALACLFLVAVMSVSLVQARIGERRG